MNAYQAMRDLCAFILHAVRWFFSTCRRSATACVVIIAVCLGFIAQPAIAQTAVVHVNIEGTPTSENGETWATAYRFLQDALAQADFLIVFDEEVTHVEIWVAAGTYRPDQRADYEAYTPSCAGSPDAHCLKCFPDDEGNRWATFCLRNNVRLFGGFPTDAHDTNEYGPFGATFDDRDWENNITILSGDILGNDQLISDTSVVVNKFLESSPCVRPTPVTATTLDTGPRPGAIEARHEYRPRLSR